MDHSGGDRQAHAVVEGVTVEPFRWVISRLDVPIGVHRGGTVVVANRALAALLGAVEPSDVEGRPIEGFIHPGDLLQARVRIFGGYEGQVLGPSTMRLVTIGGDVVPVEATPTPITYGRRPAVLIALRDISAWVDAEEALRASEARWRALVQHGTDVIAVLDTDGRFSYVSPSVSTVLAHEPEALLGTVAFDLIHPRDRDAATSALAHRVADAALPHAPIRLRIRSGGGEWRWFDTFASNRLEDPDVDGVIVNAWDVTEQVRAERHLRHLAQHDVLTGLPNRSLLAERLESALAGGRRDGTVTGLLMLDLDRFKDINDTLGHDTGDRVLVELARRLERAVRDVDLVARIGGDEFAVVLPDAGDATTVEGVARRLLAACVEPVADGGMSLRVGASIGMVLAPEHGDEPDILMRRVDAAMYRAKVGRLGIVPACDGDLDEGRRRLAAAGDIRLALERAELRCEYQPKVDLRTGRVVGLEALVRWDHPERGRVEAEELILDTEQVGLMVPLTRWVLREALGRLAGWTADGLDISLAVNVSASVLHDPQLVTMVDGLAAETGADRSRLILEVTEQAAMTNPEASLATMTVLRRRGVRFSIDDFGTGQSSLTYLHRLPVSEVKIDRSFVAELAAGGADAVICRSVIDLAHNLGLQAVAEGVETPAILALLVASSCDLGQGWELGGPVAPEDVPAACRRRLTLP